MRSKCPSRRCCWAAAPPQPSGRPVGPNGPMAGVQPPRPMSGGPPHGQPPGTTRGRGDIGGSVEAGERRALSGTDRTGAVAIGRNEGERLRRCLESIRAARLPIVYVDSGPAPVVVQKPIDTADAGADSDSDDLISIAPLSGGEGLTALETLLVVGSLLCPSSFADLCQNYGNERFQLVRRRSGEVCI